MSADQTSYKMYIDGRFIDGDEPTRAVTNPANGKAFAKVPEASSGQTR